MWPKPGLPGPGGMASPQLAKKYFNDINYFCNLPGGGGDSKGKDA
jgi:hypothetical protein